MNFESVQSYAAAQIAADPVLAPFCPALQFSPLLDEDTIRPQIADALREKGVFFEIGGVSGTDNGSTPGRFAKLDVSFDVFVAESPKVEHTPTNLSLVKAVVAAITKPVDRYETAPRCTGYESAKAENGYVLHIVSFTVPAVIA